MVPDAIETTAPAPGTCPVDQVLPLDHDPLATLTTVGS